MQFDAEKTECPLTLLAKNMQSNGHTFKSWVISQCTGHLLMTPEGERDLERLKDSKRTGHQTTHWTDLILHNFGYFETEGYFVGPQILIHCIHGNVTTILKSVPEEGLQHCFEQWQHWLN